jgi:hypothetical protein
MLPEKSRQLELLKSKLDELSVIPPTFGSDTTVPLSPEIDLSQLGGRYARRALAYVLMAKFASDHPRTTVVVGSFDEMLPETQTKSMRYPLEMAASFLWALKDSGMRLLAQTRRPLPKEIECAFRTRILEANGGFQIRKGDGEWKEFYLVNDSGGMLQACEETVEEGSPEDEEGERVVLSTVSTYANVTYAGLVSFLKGRMEEARIQRATDSLIRLGHLELRKGPNEVHYIVITDSGRSLMSSLGGR